MNELTSHTEYRNTAKVPGEIQDVKNPVIFELTARQLAFIGMAAVATIFTWLITCRVFEFSQTAVILLCLLFGSPFLAFGFIRPSNLNLEDWLSIWISNNIKSAPVRKLSAKNAYELALEHQKQKENRNKKNKSNKAIHSSKGKAKMNQDILDGKINAYFPAKKLFCYKGKFFRIYRINDSSAFSDIGLTTGMFKGYEFELHYSSRGTYLTVGLNKGSELYLDFISEDLNTALLLPEIKAEAIGIEELTDQLCDLGIYDVSIKKSAKDKPYLTFELTGSKLLKVMPDHLTLNDIITKTILITGFHNQECGSLADRLLSISDCITLSIHFRQYDSIQMLEAINSDATISDIRKAQMSKFVKECTEHNEHIFNACMFAGLTGTSEEVKQAFNDLVELCSDECLSLYSLNHQQKAGYSAILPLLCNKITFSRVISGTQLSRLMPVDTFAYEQEA